MKAIVLYITGMDKIPVGSETRAAPTASRCSCSRMSMSYVLFHLELKHMSILHKEKT